MFNLRILSLPLASAVFTTALILGAVACTKHEPAAPNPSPQDLAPEASAKTLTDVFLKSTDGMGNAVPVTFELCPNNIFLTTDPLTGEIGYFCGTVPGCPAPFVALKDPQN